MKYMDFEKAFSLYREGKTVRRDSWPRQLVLGIGLENIEHEILWGCSTNPYEYFAKETIDEQDLLANDWYVVEFKRRESRGTSIIS